MWGKRVKPVHHLWHREHTSYMFLKDFDFSFSFLTFVFLLISPVSSVKETVFSLGISDYTYSSLVIKIISFFSLNFVDSPWDTENPPVFNRRITVLIRVYVSAPLGYVTTTLRSTLVGEVPVGPGWDTGSLKGGSTCRGSLAICRRSPLYMFLQTISWSQSYPADSLSTVLRLIWLICMFLKESALWTLSFIPTYPLEYGVTSDWGSLPLPSFQPPS